MTTLENAKEYALIEIKFSLDKMKDEDLCWYRQNKNSGYSVILLYKNTVVVDSADFMTKRGKEIQNRYKETELWLVKPTATYIRMYCNAHGIDIWDKRYRYLTVKKSAEKIALASLI